MRSLQQFWTTRRIGEDRVTLTRLGPLRLWLARAEREWAYACHYGEGRDLMDLAQVPEDVVPDAMTWTTIGFGDAPRDYLFEGEIPHRPVSVKFNGPVGIPAGEEIRVFVAIPVFVRIRAISGSLSHNLGKVASDNLYRSWFGDPASGQLCHAARESVAFDPEDLELSPNSILCPISIRNDSPGSLLLNRLCLRMRKAGLYSGATHLWSSTARILYQGQNKDCQFRILEEMPAGEDNLQCLATPRESVISLHPRELICS